MGTLKIIAMNITTRYNCGRKVWFMFMNKPIEGTIVKLKIQYTDREGVQVFYGLDVFNDDGSFIEYKDVREDLVFRTKQDLLSSL